MLLFSHAVETVSVTNSIRQEEGEGYQLSYFLPFDEELELWLSVLGGEMQQLLLESK
jgi:hypothetical protein